jgi:DNA phosphorothioation-associated putative methyltransferase
MASKFMKGKKVLNNFYWHCSLTNIQPDVIIKNIARAESIANLKAENDYNIIKYDISSHLISLLWYPDFFTDPFPALETSYRIDLEIESVVKRSYHLSINPPILHRKELFIRSDDPHIKNFKALTNTAEQLGLFDNPINIGFKQAWENLITEKGFQLIGHQFIPIGNEESQFDKNEPHPNYNQISRHLTALSRSNLSAPMQCLAKHGFLDGSLSVFDYGCGKGDDIRNLSANDIKISGWDPHYASNQPKKEADIVNIGFVINVIENFQERLEALLGAYDLAHQMLVVSAMLISQNAFKGQLYNDGVITQRNTFQKYFTQTELRDFINETLDVDSIPVAPGIFYVFKDTNAEQRFLIKRQRSKRNILRLTYRSAHPKQPKLSRNEKKYLTHQHLIDPLWQLTLELGRLPEKSEIENLINITNSFTTINKAYQFMLNQFNTSLLEQARQNRIDDLHIYFALQSFTKRKPYKHLESSLQKDVKAFFGDYRNAVDSATTILYQISNTELISTACLKSAENGLGYLEEGALILHSSLVEQLPALLRIYIGCATVLYGDIEQSDLIKIHSQSGKLSLMRYDDFDNNPLPRLIERVKINLREQLFDLYQYGDDFEPTYLYLKSRYINEDHLKYAEQLNFDEQLNALNLFDFKHYGPKPQQFRDDLKSTRWEINGFNLIRSKTLPDIDSLCGKNISYRQLIECGETQAKMCLPNHPKQPDSYNALYDLVVNILDPVIDYFGMIKLTYGFCSHELSKHIKSRVAPKLDQHAAHEINNKNNYICPRLGAAIDFIIEDENMREVANWITANTAFDRLYFYGEDKPIHISYGPENKREYIDMLISKTGRRIPRKNCKV